MRGFICGVCRKHVKSARDQFAERLELRRIDAKERIAVHTVIYLCRTCATWRGQSFKNSPAGGTQEPIPAPKMTEEERRTYLESLVAAEDR